MASKSDKAGGDQQGAAMTNEFGKPLSIRSYWKGLSISLEAKLTSLKECVNHPSTGHVAESYFRELIRQHLPSRYCVDTGFVVDANGGRSPLIDIIIADTLNISPLCAEPSYKVFPVEAVCAAIEVTTSPVQRVTSRKKDISKFEADILKIAEVRRMGKARRYRVAYWDDDGSQVRESKTMSLQPRAFLLTCGEEWKKRKTYEKHLQESLAKAKTKSDCAWINAAFSLRHGLLKFQPYTEFEHRDWITVDAFFEFIFFLSHAVQTFALPNAALDTNRYRKMPQEEDYERDGGEEDDDEEEESLSGI